MIDVTSTSYTAGLPPVSDLILSGFGFSAAAPGTPLSITYAFETSAPTSGSWANDPTFTPLNSFEQAFVKQTLAALSAICNVTFSQVTGAAQLSYGNTTGPVMGDSFGQTQDPQPANPISYTAFNGAFFGATPTYPLPDDDYLAAHELCNALGLKDFYASESGWNLPGQFTNADYTTMAGVTFDTGHNQSYDYTNAVGFQILDIEALQYLYGVNPNGYTPSYANTAATLSGATLTYAVTDSSSPETIWVGANVASVKSLDFSACTTPVAINLNAASFSSNYVDAARYGDVSGGDDSIAIAVNTVFNLGIGNNLGDSLTADVTAGNNDILLGGTGNDSFTAGRAMDIFLGRGGADTAIFHDARANYTIVTVAPGVVVVTDTAASATDGMVVLDGDFTSLQFADQIVSEAASATGASHVSAPMAAILANLDALQSLAVTGLITSIAVTDSGIASLSLGSAQAAADAIALADLNGSFSVVETASGNNLSITGVANASGTTVVFSGQASQYSIMPSGDGMHFTVSTSGSSNQLANIQALRFSDFTEIVAPTPGTGGSVTGGNITELYGAVFGRVPDVAGLSFYEKALAANPGLSLQSLAVDFLSSPEYAANSAHAYPQDPAGDAQFITDCYANLLNRNPENGAVAYYQAVITQMTQGLTVGTAAYQAAELQAHAQVLVYFSASAEFLGDVQVTAAHPASAGFTGHWLVLI